MSVGMLDGMLVCAVWCALALATRADSTSTEANELSTVGTVQPPDTTTAAEEPDLYTDTEPTTPHLPRNYSPVWERGLRRSKYMMATQTPLQEVLFHERAHQMKFEGSSGMMLLVVVILPGVLFLVVFLVIIANTATPMKVPYANTKEGIVPPWMMHEYNVQSVKCYPTYGQV